MHYKWILTIDQIYLIPKLKPMQSNKSIPSKLKEYIENSSSELKLQLTHNEPNSGKTSFSQKGESQHEEKKTPKKCYFFDEVKKNLKPDDSCKTNLSRSGFLIRESKKRLHHENTRSSQDLGRWKMKQSRWPQEIALAQRRARKTEEECEGKLEDIPSYRSSLKQDYDKHKIQMTMQMKIGNRLVRLENGPIKDMRADILLIPYPFLEKGEAFPMKEMEEAFEEKFTKIFEHLQRNINEDTKIYLFSDTEIVQFPNIVFLKLNQSRGFATNDLDNIYKELLNYFNCDELKTILIPFYIQNNMDRLFRLVLKPIIEEESFPSIIFVAESSQAYYYAQKQFQKISSEHLKEIFSRKI